MIGDKIKLTHTIATFDNIAVNTLDTSDDYHITRYDNMDLNFEYSDGWEHSTMSSFKNYKRTISTGGSKEKVTFKFNGTGFAAIGATEQGAAISVKIDDEVVKESFLVPAAGSREVTYSQYDLAEGEHTVELTVVAGNYSVDGLEVMGEPIKEPIADEPSDTESGSDDSSSANGSGDKTVSDYILLIVIGVAVVVIGGVIFFVLKRRKK